MSKSKASKEVPSHHEQLLIDANEAINELFSDTTVSKQTTIDDLSELIDAIGMKIASLG